MTHSDYPRATTVPAPAVTPTPMPLPVVEQIPATVESLIELRQKYRAGLVVLGDFFAVLDRFLDGQASAKVKVKTVEVKTVEVKDK